ncbi:MAG: efflux RND transporter periplasmic adaptor subunit [Desulfosporosinus sp.]|nr:efflux RND transporter periplasmic adaptor subunit [Desulfosporosinus sp.]
MIKFDERSQDRSMSPKLAGFLAVALICTTVTGCSTAKQATAVKPPAIAVKTEKIQLGQLPNADSFLGSVTPYIQTSLSPATSGTLKVVNVRAGDIVQPGQVLASIDTSVLQAQLDQATANINVAQAQLGATGQGTDNSLAQSKSALEASQTNLTNAQSAAPATVASAQKALVTAQSQVENANVQYANGVKQAQTGLDSAQAALDAANTQAQTGLDSAQATLDTANTQVQTAQANLTKTQAAYNTANQQLQRIQQMAQSESDPSLLAAQATEEQSGIALQNAQNNVANGNSAVTKAQADLNNTQAGLQATVTKAQAALVAAQATLQAAQDSKAVQTAQAQVSQAQAALDAANITSANSIATAQASVAQSQTNNQTLINNPQLQVGTSQVQAAQAGMKVYQAQISNGQITAPVGGYVTAVNAEVGQSVGPGTGFITIASMDPLIATVDVPVNNISKMQVGQSMSVLVPATQETLEGKISAVLPAPDPTSKKYSVNITLTPGKQQALPGMPVEAFAQNSGKQGIVIPADCVLSMQSGAISVFVVENGKAVQRTVQVGNMTGTLYEITSGLQPGDIVVTQGQNLLSAGNQVQEINSSETSQSGAPGQATPPSGTQPNQGAKKSAAKS